MVVLPASYLGHGFECLFVESNIGRPAVKSDGGAFERAEADGKDPHAAVGGHLGDCDRVRAGRATAVRQQHDDTRTVRARLDRRARRGGCCVSTGVARAAATKHHRFDIDAVIRKQRGECHHQRTAGGSAALQLEAFDGRDQVFAAVGRFLNELCRAAERHDADPRARRMVFDEGFRGDLCRGDPVGLYVGRAHAERHIDCQNDGAKLRGQRYYSGWAGDGSQSGCQREQHQRRRNKPTPTLARSDRLANRCEAGIDHCDLSPAHQPQISEDAAGQNRQHPEHLWPQERHREVASSARIGSPINEQNGLPAL